MPAAIAVLDTRLLYAAQRGDAPAIRRLLAGQVCIDQPDDLGRTPLLRATQGNHLEAVAVLVQGGADRQIAGKDGVTALQHAKQAGYREMVRLLEQ